MNERDAFRHLEDLLENQPGYLRIITTLPDPDGAHLPVSNPHHWQAFPVTRFELIRLLGETGGVRAYSARGDMCDGRPSALLRRLSLYERENAPLVLRPLPEGSVRIEAGTASAGMGARAI